MVQGVTTMLLCLFVLLRVPLRSLCRLHRRTGYFRRSTILSGACTRSTWAHAW